MAGERLAKKFADLEVTATKQKRLSKYLVVGQAILFIMLFLLLLIR